MTCSSADLVADPAADRARLRRDARSRALRLAAAALVGTGALLGAANAGPDATSAVFTDTETLVTTVRTVPDFDAPRPAPAPPATSATATPTATVAPAAPPAREDLRAPREGRGR
jgi:hypothetical protein